MNEKDPVTSDFLNIIDALRQFNLMIRISDFVHLYESKREQAFEEDKVKGKTDTLDYKKNSRNDSPNTQLMKVIDLNPRLRLVKCMITT